MVPVFSRRIEVKSSFMNGDGEREGESNAPTPSKSSRQVKGRAGAVERRANGRPASRCDGHPNQITQCKKQLLEGPEDIFGSTAGRGKELSDEEHQRQAYRASDISVSAAKSRHQPIQSDLGGGYFGPADGSRLRPSRCHLRPGDANDPPLAIVENAQERSTLATSAAVSSPPPKLLARPPKLQKNCPARAVPPAGRSVIVQPTPLYAYRSSMPPRISCPP